MTRTLWRELLYREIKKVSLEGDVLDLGGSYLSAYQKNFDGQHVFKVVNMDSRLQRDYEFDLEENFVTEDSSYDAILCFNVLEHIFNYQNLLRESYRTLKTPGTFILAVPFLIQLHPSPHDHWRFSEETLRKICADAGFKSVSVQAIGTGVFGGLAQLSYGILHYNFLRWVVNRCAIFLDNLVSRIKKENVYDVNHYPLGYLVTAYKK